MRSTPKRSSRSRSSTWQVTYLSLTSLCVVVRAEIALAARNRRLSACACARAIGPRAPQYANNEGPPPFSAGTADIEINLGVEMQNTLTNSHEGLCGGVNVSLLVFETDETISLDDIDLCNVLGDQQFKRFTRTKMFGEVEAHNLVFSQHAASCGTLDDDQNDPSVSSVFLRETCERPPFPMSLRRIS